jgi:hypothetical protein
VEFDVWHSDLRGQLASLGHELAHAVEVACLTPAERSARLQLLRRAGNRGGARRTVETPFAVAAGRQVDDELSEVAGRSGLLTELAEAHRISLP